jgi:hypothetical protein
MLVKFTGLRARFVTVLTNIRFLSTVNPFMISKWRMGRKWRLFRIAYIYTVYLYILDKICVQSEHWWAHREMHDPWGLIHAQDYHLLYFRRSFLVHSGIWNLLDFSTLATFLFIESLNNFTS